MISFMWPKTGKVWSAYRKQYLNVLYVAVFKVLGEGLQVINVSPSEWWCGLLPITSSMIKRFKVHCR